MVSPSWVTLGGRFVFRLVRITPVEARKRSDLRTRFCEGRDRDGCGPGRIVLRSRAGMTLIEVLIAVALMAMLSAGLVASLQIGATSWSITHDALMLDRRIATANALLRSLLVSVVPLNARISPSSELPSQQFLFFQGEPRSMRFVSSHSMFAGTRGGLQLTELRVATYQDGFRLLLNQFDYRGPYALGQLVTGRVAVDGAPGMRWIFQPISALPTTLVLADELHHCNFSYLPKGRPNGSPAMWARVWHESNLFPVAVKVVLTPTVEPDRQARALPVSVTVPIFTQKVQEHTESEINTLRRAGRLP